MIALVFLAAIASDSWGQSKRPPTKSQQEKTQSQEQKATPDQRGTEQLPLVVQPLPTKKNAEIAEQEKRDAKEKTNSDWWTWFLGVLTIVALFGQLAVFIAQAYFLKGTLKATAEAATAAVKAAEHIPTVERAYLFGGPTKIEMFAGSKETHFKLIIDNAGKTPAIITAICLCFPESEPTGSPIYLNSRISSFELVINAGMAGQLLPFNASTDTIEPFYVAGYFSYLDIFRKTHTSRFCVRIIPEDGKFEPVGPPAWNDWD